MGLGYWGFSFDSKKFTYLSDDLPPIMDQELFVEKYGIQSKL